MQRFYKSSSKKPERVDAVEQQVTETISSWIITKAQFISIVNEVGVEKSDADKGKFLLKTVLSAGTYLAYDSIKEAARYTLFQYIGYEFKEEQTPKDEQAAVRKALLTFLNSSIGQTDKNSYKYRVLQKLFAFNAKNDSEAKRYVECTIRALKQQDMSQELQDMSPELNDSPRLSGL